MNDTILKFGYPHNLIKEFEYWVVLLRPKQIALGCLVLACKENAVSLGEVSIDAYKELKSITNEIEATLQRAFNMDKINYLALMMVDKEVHFHVIPRYSSKRMFSKIEFEDKNWPKPPNLFDSHNLTDTELEDLKKFILISWK